MATAAGPETSAKSSLSVMTLRAPVKINAKPSTRSVFQTERPASRRLTVRPTS